MDTNPGMQQLRDNLSTYVWQVLRDRQTVKIHMRGQPVALLTPLPSETDVGGVDPRRADCAAPVIDAVPGNLVLSFYHETINDWCWPNEEGAFGDPPDPSQEYNFMEWDVEMIAAGTYRDLWGVFSEWWATQADADGTGQ